MRLCILFAVFFCASYSNSNRTIVNDFFYKYLTHVVNPTRGPCDGIYLWICPVGLDPEEISLPAAAESALTEWITFEKLQLMNWTSKTHFELEDFQRLKFLTPQHNDYFQGFQNIYNRDIPLSQNLENFFYLLRSIETRQKYFSDMGRALDRMNQLIWNLLNDEHSPRIPQLFGNVTIELRQHLKIFSIMEKDEHLKMDNQSIFRAANTFQKIRNEFLERPIHKDTNPPADRDVEMLRQTQLTHPNKFYILMKKLTASKLAAHRTIRDFQNLFRLDIFRKVNKIGTMKQDALNGNSFSRITPIIILLIDRLKKTADQTDDINDAATRAILYGAVGTELLIETLRRAGFSQSDAQSTSWRMAMFFRCLQGPDINKCLKEGQVEVESMINSYATQLAFKAFKIMHTTRSNHSLSENMYPDNQNVKLGTMFFIARALVHCKQLRKASSQTFSWGARTLIDTSSASVEDFVVINNCNDRGSMRKFPPDECKFVYG